MAHPWDLGPCAAASPAIVAAGALGEGPPPRALRVDLVPSPRGGSVLCIGGALDASTERELLLRGSDLQVVEDLAAALARLHAERFDVAVVRPSIEVGGDGVRFVRGLKFRRSGALAPPIESLAIRLEAVPFVIRPLDDVGEFAVFRGADRWFLGHTEAVPLFRAILAAAESEPFPVPG